MYPWTFSTKSAQHVIFNKMLSIAEESISFFPIEFLLMKLSGNANEIFASRQNLMRDVTNFWLFPHIPYVSSKIANFALLCFYALVFFLLLFLCICPDSAPFNCSREAQRM